MKNAIILHGQPGKKEYYDPRMPSMSNAHWIPWLQGQLLKNDIAAATPEVPFAFKPEWNIWKQEVERFEIGPDTLIVGHSRGTDFWLRWLSENKDATVGKVVLIAPSIGYLTRKENHFGHYIIDPDLVKRTHGVVVFYSDNDADNILKSVDEIRATIKNLTFKKFHLGHFTERHMGRTSFPELLEELI